jgi:hypothetical protein
MRRLVKLDELKESQGFSPSTRAWQRRMSMDGRRCTGDRPSAASPSIRSRGTAYLRDPPTCGKGGGAGVPAP